MQVWQTSLTRPGLTLFANPLAPASPLHALTEGSHMRTRMAMDVFAANAIRAIRLQSPRVGVVMAAQQGGKILFGFNATDSVFELANVRHAAGPCDVDRLFISQRVLGHRQLSRPCIAVFTAFISLD